MSPHPDLLLGKTLIRRIRADWEQGYTLLQRDRLASLQYCCLACRVPVLQALTDSLAARWFRQHVELLPKYPSKTARRLRVARGKPPYSSFDLYCQQEGRRRALARRVTYATAN
jgi:hypothetical protein